MNHMEQSGRIPTINIHYQAFNSVRIVLISCYNARVGRAILCFPYLCPYEGS